MEFCKPYNAATESQRGQIIPVEITVYEDRSFTFITKTPPAARLIKRPPGVEKGSRRAAQEQGRASSPASRCATIAETKMPDLNANDLDAAEKIIAGTARSMGITVEGRVPAPPAPPARRGRAERGPTYHDSRHAPQIQEQT